MVDVMIVAAFALGALTHGTLLEVCDYLGYPVYTREDRDMIWREVLN